MQGKCPRKSRLYDGNSGLCKEVSQNLQKGLRTIQNQATHDWQNSLCIVARIHGKPEKTSGVRSPKSGARRPGPKVRKLEPRVRGPESGVQSRRHLDSRPLPRTPGPEFERGGAFEQSNPHKFPHIYRHSEMSIYSACAVGARGELPNDTARPSANR